MLRKTEYVTHASPRGIFVWIKLINHLNGITIHHRRFAFFESRSKKRRPRNYILYSPMIDRHIIWNRALSITRQCVSVTRHVSRISRFEKSRSTCNYTYTFSICHLRRRDERTPEWRSTCANLTERRNKTRTMPHWDSKCQRIFDDEWWTCLVVLVVRVFFSVSCFSRSRANEPIVYVRAPTHVR